VVGDPIKRSKVYGPVPEGKKIAENQENVRKRLPKSSGISPENSRNIPQKVTPVGVGLWPPEGVWWPWISLIRQGFLGR